MKISELGEYDKRHKFASMSANCCPKKNLILNLHLDRMGWSKTIPSFCPIKDCVSVRVSTYLDRLRKDSESIKHRYLDRLLKDCTYHGAAFLVDF
jgi:hypothetical protein